MFKIDVKDKKILYQLDLNSRQSFRSIGRKVGLKKDLVIYRIKKLQENGIIKNFFTIIDTSPLGYTIPRFYLNYQYITPEIKEEIIDYFVKSKYVGFVHSTEGHHDLTLVMVVKNVTKFNFFWEKSMNKYRDYFSKQVFSLFFNEKMFRYSFLFDKDTPEWCDRSNVEVFGGENIVEIDELDRNILKIITPNARIQTTEIAKELKSSTKTISDRIKKLLKFGVIKEFKVNIDFNKLGYQKYKVDIDLKDPLMRNKILNYIKMNPNLYNIIKSIGYVDLELLFYLKNQNELHKIMEDLSNNFPKSIRNYTYFYTIDTYKYNYLPGE
jgi:Lrp/AsnC family transcriptional regulator for asnA, asnC and gidA